MLTTAALACVPALAAGTSLAGVITANDLTHGQTTERLAVETMNIDVQTISGHFQLKSRHGYDIMGISGGGVHGEIDHNESMLFTFDQGVNISSLQLGLLFVDGQHGDRVNEGAIILVNGTHEFELRLENPTKASWYGNGSVFAHSPGLEGSAGVFEIAHESNIFGMLVTSLELSAPNDGIGGGAASDYGFVSMNVTSPVPTPGAVSLLAMGGLLASKRRR